MRVYDGGNELKLDELQYLSTCRTGLYECGKWEMNGASSLGQVPQQLQDHG